MIFEMTAETGPGGRDRLKSTSDDSENQLRLQPLRGVSGVSDGDVSDALTAGGGGDAGCAPARRADIQSGGQVRLHVRTAVARAGCRGSSARPPHVTAEGTAAGALPVLGWWQGAGRVHCRLVPGRCRGGPWRSRGCLLVYRRLKLAYLVRYFDQHILMFVMSSG